MAGPISISGIDLTPLAGKRYFNFDREWREEFIYFLLVDRFHDGRPRPPVDQAARSHGFATPDDFYGGTLSGVANNLDYISGLGCTAIWLSPVFENNPHAYHGYNVANYLNIDPHFGSKQDLIDLVDAAHQRDMRVILDVVINHSGDNWEYQGGQQQYDNDRQFAIGQWHPGRPVPIELQKDELYHRRGRMSNYDSYPELQHADIDTLKDYANDDDAPGSELINILIKAHCYWIREADIDGFRVDAVKHMGELACSRFCSNVREYAYALGKRGFFLFGEVASPSDDMYNRYIGQNTSRQDGGNTVFFGLDSVLDFRLAEGVWGDDNNAPLREVLLGNKGPETLFNRNNSQRDRALNRGELGRFLVRFVDNHDSFWQPSGRFGNIASDEQVIGAAGFLLCGMGTACLYYGTEQGFDGHGGDNQIREAMFDRENGGVSLLNTSCRIYSEIAKIAAVLRDTPPLRFGRIYYRQISGDGVNFGFPYGSTYTLAFSRLLYANEVLVAYNVSNQARNDRVIVDATLHAPGTTMRYLYGKTGSETVGDSSGARFVQLRLEPHQFVVLA